LIILTTVTLANWNSALPDYGDETETCRSCFNLLKTKRLPLYIRNQSVPRCKHFPPRL